MVVSQLLLISASLWCAALASSNSQLEDDDQISSSYVYSNRWAVQVRGGMTAANKLAGDNGFINLGKIGNLEDYFYFECTEKRTNTGTLGQTVETKGIRKMEPNEMLTRKLKSHPKVGYVQQEQLKMMVNYDYYSPPSDPGWKQQWPLSNNASARDINVEPVWMQGISGSETTVAIVDNGVDYQHRDLALNFDIKRSWDFNMNDSDPTPDDYSSSEAYHGTSCAGEVAMIKDNGICGVGVAYSSHVAALKFNLSAVNDAEKARMWSHMGNYIDVYSNSFGPLDSGYVVDGPNYVLNLSMATAMQQGRNGKGSIIVMASGNGGLNGDSCAANGYTSSIYTISAGSADETSHEAVYDEQCASKMVVTFSYNSTAFHDHNQVYTTTLNGKCSDSFTGTSASAPLVAATVALALEANSNLTWRDVQYLLAYTSNPDILMDGEFQQNGGGLKVSHKFGFGALDGEAMVTRARRWIGVPHQLFYSTGGRLFGKAYPGDPYRGTFNISSENVPIVFLEHVMVIVTVYTAGCNVSYSIKNFNDAKEKYNFTAEEERSWLISPHPRRGDIKIELISPSRTTSTLLPYRELDFINNHGYEDWPFTSVQHWGENPIGQWSLVVTYRSSSAQVIIAGAGLTLYGTGSVPQAVQNIPPHCDPACRRGCSGIGPDHCDACRVKRVSDTLECVNECPEGTYLYKSHYCNTCANCNYTTPTTPFVKTSFSMIFIIAGGAVGGLTCVITITIFICSVFLFKRRGINSQQQYVRLQFDEIAPTPV